MSGRPDELVRPFVCRPVPMCMYVTNKLNKNQSWCKRFPKEEFLNAGVMFKVKVLKFLCTGRWDCAFSRKTAVKEF